MDRLVSRLAISGALVAGCADARTGNGSFGEGGDGGEGPWAQTGGPLTSGGLPPPGGTGPDTSADGGPQTPGPFFDVGAGSDGDTNNVNGPGCEKADFLFVIDNSGSMGGEQQNLIASFPGFISTIQGTLQAQDYHVMVVDTDASGGTNSTTTSCSNGDCTCSPAPVCCDTVCAFNPGYTCNGFPCGALPPAEDCDGTIGAGKTHNEDGTVCLPGGGPRYMTEATPDLPGTFSCAADVGTFGSGNEVPMESMMEAVSDALAAPGECNEGFLRDDAILVVTFITDEEDDGKSPGDPADWAQAIIDAKKGQEEAIVVLGLFDDPDHPIAGCDAEPAPRLRDFVEEFGARGFAASVCEPDYSPFFLDAVQVIDLTCDEFNPEG